MESMGRSPGGAVSSRRSSRPRSLSCASDGAATSPSRDWECWLYLAMVIDIARRVVGFAMAHHLRTELISDALSNAIAARDPQPGVIFTPIAAARRLNPPSTQQLPTPPSRRRTRSPCRSDGPASAGTTRSPSRSSPPSRASSSTPGRVAYQVGSPQGSPGVHRLGQRHPAALIPRLPKPGRLRKQPPRK
jgi:hypothetical protein